MKATFKQLRDDYYSFSGKASDAARQLAFGGLAIVWFFHTQQKTGIVLPAALFWPAIAFVLALGLDLFHYAAASLIWGAFTASKRNAGAEDDDVIEVPKPLNYPALICFSAKLVVLLWGYADLLDYMFRTVELRP